MKDELRQPVVVENRPGAGGRLVAEAVKNAPADGSVLMLTPIVVTVLAPMVFSKLPYDPLADFAPVAQVANFQFALSVNAAHPARTMKDLVAWYKANPTKANYGSPAPGSLPHFFGVMIARGADVELVHIPYNGGAPMMNALMGDQLSAAIDTTVEQVGAAPHRPGPDPGHLGRDTQRAAARGADVRRVGPRRRRRNRVVRRLRAGEDAGGDDSPAQCSGQQGAGEHRAARALHQARPRAERRNGGLGAADGAGRGALGAGREGIGVPRRLSARGDGRPERPGAARRCDT